MRYVIDFERYPRAICILVFWTSRGVIETPCSNTYLQWLYLQGYDVPLWWVNWHSTQDWIAGLQGERVAIVGSRDYPHLDRVRDYVNQLPMNTVIVSGGAKGVDSIAEQTAKARGMKTIIYLPDWETHGKSAGFLRNQDIVNACDRLVAFWHRDSKGTAHSIRLAQEAGKPVTVYDSTGAIAA